MEPKRIDGSPTGQVANLTLFTATPAFDIDSFGPADFIFATEDGEIEAWNTALTDTDGIRLLAGVDCRTMRLSS